jgi:hypothetical protein
MNMRSRTSASASLMAIAFAAQAQWSANLPPVSQDGYYTVILSPEVVGRSQPGLGDLRLLDSLEHEVAFVLEEEPPFHDRTWMRTYKLLLNERERKHTIIEMEADSAANVDELQLHIRNAMVHKLARITGSDDRVNWYMIQDACLSVGEDGGSTSVLRFVDLPLSDYRYYRIRLDDSLSAPVQVLDLGHSGRARSEGAYSRINGLRYDRIEDGSTTRIALYGPSPFRADRIHLTIANDGPFARQGSFMVRHMHDVRSRRHTVERTQEDVLGSFSLSSHDRGLVQGPSVITDTLWLIIENRNDQPLNIAGVQAFQLEHRLVTRLRTGMRYTLVTGDAKAIAPHYDLEQFRDSLPATLASLDVPAMTAMPKETAHAPLFAPGMNWVWAAIIGLGALIAVSAVRLLRRTEMPN